MRLSPFSFLILAGSAALTLSSCNTVKVKSPAGDAAAKLDAEIWEGTWIAADGGRFRTTIVDAKNGRLHIHPLDPDKKPESIDNDFDLLVRQLGNRTVATLAELDAPEKKADKDGSPFFRIVASSEHLVVFSPDENLLKTAVSSGTLAGEVRQPPPQTGDSKGFQIKTDTTILERFGIAEVGKLPLLRKGEVVDCFEPDPAIVAVREKKPEPQAKPKGKKR